MEFKKADFDGLKYNPFPLPPKTDLLQTFPELQRFPEFSLKPDNIDINLVLRFIIYTYDKRSPLLSEKNLAKRKMIACKLSGFELEDEKPTAGRPPAEKPHKKYPLEVEAMIRGENPTVNKMICRYCRNQKDLPYALLVAGMESFFDNIGKLSEPMANADMDELNRRATLYQHMVKMISSLESNADDIFQGDTPLMYDADVIEQEEKGIIRSYPEFIASLREDGELVKTFKKLDKTN